MSRYQSGTGGRRDRGFGGTTRKESETYFDPSLPLEKLVDELAEKQAKVMPSGRDGLKSSQLRKFFGEIKELFRRLEQGADYEKEISPMFKMMRSKVSYAWRNGDRGQSKIPQAFYDFMNNGISRANSVDEFKTFVQHFEAVVGFLYGLGKVGK